MCIVQTRLKLNHNKLHSICLKIQNTPPQILSQKLVHDKEVHKAENFIFYCSMYEYDLREP